MTSSRLEQAAIESLSEEERSRAVVYVSDRVLEPGDELEVDGRRVQVVARTLEGQELDAAWTRIAREAPEYAAYLSKTDRAIPVVRLEEPADTSAVIA